jgi:hypothetical protein
MCLLLVPVGQSVPQAILNLRVMRFDVVFELEPADATLGREWIGQLLGTEAVGRT